MDTTYSSGATGLPSDGSGPNDPVSSAATGMGSVAGGSGASGYDDMQKDSGPALREELADMKRDLDALIARASTLSDRELSRARDQLISRFASMRRAAKGMADDARQQLDRSVDVTSDYVREKPFQSVAIAAAAGMLLGALLRRD
jgi:ElaB/YqjD/DUF883 family membrane-anchored ribosome-binding protein